MSDYVWRAPNDGDDQPEEKIRVTVFVISQDRIPLIGADKDGYHYHVLVLATDNVEQLSNDLREIGCTIRDRDDSVDMPFYGELHYLEATYRCQPAWLN